MKQGVQIVVKINFDKKENLQEIAEQLSNGVPFGDASLHLDAIFDEDYTFLFKIKKNDQIITSTVFSVDLDKKLAIIDAMSVNPDLRHGQGIGRKIAYNHISLFTDLGMQRVEVSTYNSGSTFWARFGFTPSCSNWLSLKEILRDPIQSVLPKLSLDNYVKVTNALTEKDPQALWSITDHLIDDTTQEKLAPSILKETSWVGRVSLNNESFLNRMIQFVGKDHVESYPNSELNRNYHLSRACPPVHHNFMKRTGLKVG